MRPKEGPALRVRQDEVVHAAFLEHGDGDLLHLLYSPGTHRLDQRVPFGEALGARQGFLFVNPEEAVETLQVVLDVLLKLVPDLRVDAQENARRENEDRQEENPSDGHDELALETAQTNQYEGPLSARLDFLS